MSNRIKDIKLGGKYGSRTVVSEVFRKEIDGSLMAFVNCRCSCGEVDAVYATSLVRGRANQCKKCANKNHPNRGRKPKHGLWKNPLLGAWNSMHSRCSDPRYKLYHRYGGRGISVCKRWSGEDGILNFAKDMGERPGKGWSLDRIDNDKGYSPENCRWATASQQARNRSTSRILEYKGESLCLQAWADKTGITSATIHKRITRGWTVGEALGMEARS